MHLFCFLNSLSLVWLHIKSRTKRKSLFVDKTLSSTFCTCWNKFPSYDFFQWYEILRREYSNYFNTKKFFIKVVHMTDSFKTQNRIYTVYWFLLIVWSFCLKPFVNFTAECFHTSECNPKKSHKNSCWMGCSKLFSGVLSVKFVFLQLKLIFPSVCSLPWTQLKTFV